MTHIILRPYAWLRHCANEVRASKKDDANLSPLAGRQQGEDAGLHAHARQHQREEKQHQQQHGRRPGAEAQFHGGRAQAA